jgi:hypothetical protein
VRSPGHFPPAPRRNLHLVVAGVGIRLQIADIGDVHDMPDTIAKQLERASKHILENTSGGTPARISDCSR